MSLAFYKNEIYIIIGYLRKTFQSVVNQVKNS